MKNSQSFALVMMMMVAVVYAASLYHQDKEDKLMLDKILTEVNKLLQDMQDNEEITCLPDGQIKCLCLAEKALTDFIGNLTVSPLRRQLKSYMDKHRKRVDCELNPYETCSLRVFLNKVYNCTVKEMKIVRNKT